MNTNKNINLLKNFILFKEMDNIHLQEIHDLLESDSFDDGNILFFAGEEGDRVYFLKKGNIKVIKSTRDGNEQILEIIKPGEVFGEVVLFGIDNYPATTRAMGEVEVDYLTRNRFRKYYQENPEIGWGMLKVMARKLYRSQHKIENLGLRNTRGRVANMLIDMVNNFGDCKRNVILNLNQQEMADYIGTSRETVSRTLGELKKEGIIRIKDNKLTILDLDKLRDILQ